MNVTIDKFDVGLGALLAGIVPTAFPNSIRDTSVYLGAAANARFVNAVGPDGTPWADLKQARRRKRDRKRNRKSSGAAQGQHKPLQDTKLLMGSMSASVMQPARGAVIQRTMTSLIQGTNVEYAPHHQFGTKGRTLADGRTVGAIPARPFLGINAEDEKNIIRIALTNIGKGTP